MANSSDTLSTPMPHRQTGAWLTLGVVSGLVLFLMYSYWNTLSALGEFWDSPQYSHGYLVPAFAVALLWMYRTNLKEAGKEAKDEHDFAEELPEAIKYALVGVPAAVIGLLYVVQEYTAFGSVVAPISTPLMILSWSALIVGTLVVVIRWKPFDEVAVIDRWLGLGLLLVGVLLRLAAARTAWESPEMATFVPSLLGAFLLAGGRSLLIKAGPAVLFLIFMFPLPYSAEQAVLVPLKKVAVVGSEYSLQTMGFGAFREGQVIKMGEGQPLNVADACSGLRMLTVFMALCVAVAFLIERPWWERIVVMLSSVPIAIASNIFRIVLIGVAQYYGYDKLGQFIHDQAQFIMMPAAMGLLFLEIWILSKIFVEVEAPTARAVAGRGGGPGGGSGGRGRGPGGRGRGGEGGEGRSGRRRQPVGS